MARALPSLAAKQEKKPHRASIDADFTEIDQI